MADWLLSAWTVIAAIPHLGWWLSLGWLAYLLLLGGWIVLQKREPVATLSWLLSLALLPYVGFVIYAFLGPQRIHRQRLRRARARLPRPASAPPLADGSQHALLQLARHASGLPAAPASEARLLVDGAATYAALLEAIAAARDHIHLEYYIWAADETGTRLRDALVARARAGVHVRLLLDAVGSAQASRHFLRPLTAAGARVAWFHPNRWRLLKRPWLNLRSHRKLVVVDGLRAFTGGINITDDENEALRADAYRDLHLALSGDIVASLQLVFLEDWAYATGRPAPRVDAFFPPPAPVASSMYLQALPSGPDADWEAIHRVQVSAIQQARTRVWLATPYFVPGEAARMALTSAALAGLDVRLLVPARSDSRWVTLAARSYFDELLAAGVRVFEYGPRMLHSKALLVDAGLTVIGSANFDSRSFRLNFELSVLGLDAGFAGRLAEHLAHELASAREVRAPRAAGLWRRRLPEAVARLLSPLL
jgi:cardiolipin synthase